MRVIRWRARDARDADVASESGAIAVLIAMLLPLVLGLSAVALNYASLITERRALITATDAAALAAAIVRSEGGDAVAVCRDLLATNHSPEVAASAGCLLQDDGSVFVRAHSTPPFFFLPVGSGLTAEAVATSRAIAGYPTGIYGTRPFGICVDMPQLQTYLASGPPGARDSTTIHVIANLNATCDPMFTGTLLQRIVDGVVPLDGCGGTGENDLNIFLQNGSDCVSQVCDVVSTREAWGSSNKTQLQSSLVTDRTFPVYLLGRNSPDHNRAAAVGCAPSTDGGRTTFTVMGFVGMTIHGTPTVSGNVVSMRVSFSELQVTGPCCALEDAAGIGGVRTTMLCRSSLDPDACTR
jgi:hypothetical protein